MKKAEDPIRVSGEEGLARLADFAKRIIAVPRSEVVAAEKRASARRQRQKQKRASK